MTGDGIVQIAYLYGEHVSHSWHESMRGLLEYDLTHGQRIARRPLNMRCSSGVIAHVRNYGTRLFLDKTPHEWLLFIDTDMGFPNDAVQRLLEAADPVQRPVVGALCFAAMESGFDGMGGWRRTLVPTMYKLGRRSDDERPSFCYYGPYEPDAVVPVAGTGGAFLLIHRSVLEKLRVEHGNHWWNMLYDHEDDIIGEDIAFCGRLMSAGITPHVHTGVKTTHHKTFHVGELDYVMQESVTLQPYPEVPLAVDLSASMTALDNRAHEHDGMWKLAADLGRYEEIIAATKPEIIVETGTHTGASARWFASLGLDVITVDISHDRLESDLVHRVPNVLPILGSSVDEAVARRVAALVDGRRCMVSLDSDHTAAHVVREIELYGPLVSSGCYLVVEDALFGYAPDSMLQEHGIPLRRGTPLDAIAKMLHGNPEWSRDIGIERADPTSQNPAGWWVRNG